MKYLYPPSIDYIKVILITNKQLGTASTQNTYNTPFPDARVAASNVMSRDATMNRSNARTSSSIGGGVRDT